MFLLFYALNVSIADSKMSSLSSRLNEFNNVCSKVFMFPPENAELNDLIHVSPTNKLNLKRLENNQNKQTNKDKRLQRIENIEWRNKESCKTRFCEIYFYILCVTNC